MKDILITGGAGFVGSHLCDRLVDNNQVICLDNLGSGRVQNLAHLEDNDRFRLTTGDVRDLPDFDHEFDEIYHLASRASPKDFESNPVDIALTNSRGTHQILDLAREHDARVLLASTSEVYGDPEVHPQHEEYNGNVNPRGPRAVYDEGKRFSEALGTAYTKTYNTDIRTVRIFNTYGPRMSPDDGRVIPNFVTQALEHRDLTVYGDGSQTRSFCYVDDLIEGIVSTMEADDLAGEVLNLGSPDERTILELAEIIIDITENDVDITYEPLPKDDPQQRRPDIERAKNILNWQPTIKLRDGIERTIAYFDKINA